MEPLVNFDWNNISKDQQDAVAIMLSQLETMGKLDPTTESHLKKKFGLEDPEMIDYKESKIYNLAREFGIFCQEEGFKTKEDGNRVSMIRIVSDVETLDAFLEYARIVLNDYKKEEDEYLDKQAKEQLENVDNQSTHSDTSVSNSKLEEEYLEDLISNIDV